MRGLLASAAVAAVLIGVAPGAHAQTAQQTLMKTCNATAGTQHLSGDARKSFMSDCLSGKSAAAAPAAMTPQERMKSCNAQAGTQKLTGDTRKSFMSSCLKG